MRVVSQLLINSKIFLAKYEKVRRYYFWVIIMWSTKLKQSYLQIIISSSFYLLLIMASLFLFADTSFNAYTFVVIILLIVEWWRSLSYFQTITGELALFHHINQIYWHNQRWHLMRKPLILRYSLFLNLKSRRTGQHCTLFLMSDNLTTRDWRILRYYLYQLDFN